ncbi:malto-oligosyltrehalose synthase [Luteococcus peritonei]|uniref:Malto-oligosyltrehalose synthase n=1 Tax=Luteococcus peritonei TaxID=88874 RepID=A0ABW4RRD4_9ACTN
MTPTSTYRLQITPDFRLQDAAAVVDYLAELGVGAVYLSPVLASTEGSGHGYDVTDPTIVDPQRGGEQGWQELVAAAREAGLEVVVDIVPNHLGVQNAWQNPTWWSVLAEGQDSAHAAWFDIDWSADRIVLPVLGEESDLDRLELSPDASELSFYEHRFPVAAGTARPGDDPREVHDRQHYRLVPGSQGNDLLTHRRFFTVATLAGVRQEDPEVFAASHERVLRMVREDGLAGLRVDHPDGLSDPRGYFEQLSAQAPGAWLVAEKILEHGEPLPDWRIDGTSGYDAMTEVNQVFVDPAAEGFFTEDYRRRTGDQLTVEQHMLQGKLMVASTQFGAETRRLLELLDLDGIERDRAARALLEVAARLEVYRTYLPEENQALVDALQRTRREVAELDDVLDVLQPQLLDASREAARRFQQFTGAVMAKGVEDTAWYRANRFVALNEVGGNPASFGTSPEVFHEAMARREAELSRSMTALSTHDTKRGEGVRARLAALAELPEQWSRFADTFAERTSIAEPTFAHLLAQTLAGMGAVPPQRLHDYATKAMREAGLATGWTSPDEAFEASVHAAIEAAYDDEVLRQAWQQIQQLLTAPGHSNDVSAKLVQLAMPGVPDVYQGTEVWEDSLVDPDNRRPVDYQALRALLDAEPHEAVDPAFKQTVVRTALRLRRDRPELFTGYRALRAQGEAAEHLLAFERDGLVALATRLPVGLQRRGGWGETTLELPGSWTDQIGGATVDGQVPVGQLLDWRPVALLVRD